MILKMFTVRDAKAEMYNSPFAKRTMGEGERAFEMLAKDKESMLFKHPEDYDLYYLGDYDDVKGVIIPLDTPQHVAKAITFQTPSKRLESV